MRALHVTPTHFADASIVGGAERYAWELARAMSAQADVTFFALADRSGEWTRDGVRVIHAAGRVMLTHTLARNPISRQLAAAIRAADVVHCHQVHTFLTSACLAIGRALRKPVFVTDLGGGHPYSPTNYVPLLRSAAAMLLISDYSKQCWASAPAGRRPAKLETIYAGVDIDRFRPGGAAPSPHEVLFVGRILPHKGIEHLIDAVRPPLSLRVVGRAYDTAYLDRLRGRADGKAVTFELNADDETLVGRYQSALALVLPSLEASELFGLVVAESMACGRPAVVSRTGALPEVVEDGVTGWIVPPGDSNALAGVLQRLAADPAAATAMGQRGRARVTARYTWPVVAERCLAAYRAAG